MRGEQGNSQGVVGTCRIEGESKSVGLESPTLSPPRVPPPPPQPVEKATVDGDSKQEEVGLRHQHHRQNLVKEAPVDGDSKQEEGASPPAPPPKPVEKAPADGDSKQEEVGPATQPHHRRNLLKRHL